MLFQQLITWMFFAEAPKNQINSSDTISWFLGDFSAHCLDVWVAKSCCESLKMPVRLGAVNSNVSGKMIFGYWTHHWQRRHIFNFVIGIFQSFKPFFLFKLCLFDCLSFWRMIDKVRIWAAIYESLKDLQGNLISHAAVKDNISILGQKSVSGLIFKPPGLNTQ